MKGMILAAGFGTRFRPATLEVPKPMIPLGNRPLISYPLESLLAAGVSEITINLHHLGDAIENYVLAAYGGRTVIHFSREEETILGTGGGVRAARGALDGDDFFLLNGDTVQFPPLADLAARRRESGALASLLLRHPPAHDRFTPVLFDAGEVTGFGGGRGEPLMFSGAHCIAERIFTLLPDRPVSGIVEDVYVPVLRAGTETIAAVVHDGPWFDIGTPRRYLEASEAIRKMMLGGLLPLPERSEALIEEESIASESSIAGRIAESVTGPGCVVEKGAIVERSVLWRGARVGAGAIVRDSILGNGAQVPPGAVIEGALVCRRLPNADYPTHCEWSADLVSVAIES